MASADLDRFDAPVEPSDAPPDAVALVGIACRFADVEGPHALWDALLAGRELVTTLPGATLPGATQPDRVLAGGVLRDADCFDAEFFAMSPREAELTDPQQRVFLEACWHALEHAGHDPARFAGDIGVFAGSGVNTYLPLLLEADQGWSANPMSVDFGNEKDFLPTRVSYKLGLTGPSVAVQTACSTSLVAIHLASQSLADYECDLALAGGCSIALERGQGYRYVEDGILSPDGHCRPFDRGSAGTVPSDGVAVVVLRRLADALASGDRVIAVLLGSAIRNDGRGKVGFSAPSVDGQISTARAAYEAAGIDPATVGLVEAHGTGTELGDPIEITALSSVLGARDGGAPCHLSAVKATLGHTDTAAGAAGLIAAALSLQHATLLPVLHYEAPNPRLGLDPSRLRILREPHPWARGRTPRRAAVNSLGVGGTNAHVVLQEAPAVRVAPATPGWRVVPLSAATPAALDLVAARLRDHLQTNPHLDLTDVAHTMQWGRAELRHRVAVVAAESDDLVTRLAEGQVVRSGTAVEPGAPPRLVLLFPGGGAQHAGMAEALYRDVSAFRRCLDACVAEVRPQLDPALVAWLDDGLAATRASAWIERPELALPALFLVECALAATLAEVGLIPDGMLGHSLGEYAAACRAGVLSLADAYAVVRERGRLFAAISAGGMLSVPLGEVELEPYLDGRALDLAAVNGAQRSVLTGPVEELDRLRDVLARDGLDARMLPLATAAHSRAVEPFLDGFGEFLSGVRLSAPQVPFVSNLTGTWADADAVQTPEYWVAHLRQPVRFRDGLHAIATGGPAVLLEVGPGATLTSLARRELATDNVAAIPLCGHADDPRPAAEILLTALASAWVRGRALQWTALDEGRPGRRVPCPGYPFERRRFSPSTVASTVARVAEPDGVRVSVPGWRRLAAPSLGPAAPPEHRWLLVPDEAGLAERLREALRSRGYAVSLCRPDDLPGAIADHFASAGQPVEVVDLTPLGVPDRTTDVATRYGHALAAAARLGAAVAGGGWGSARLTVLTRHALDVTGGSRVDPALAPYLALCSVMPAESGGPTRLLDVGAGHGRSSPAGDLLDLILPVLCTVDSPRLAALLGQHWWLPEPITVAELPAEPFASDCLPDRPVVLITGGLGGVGGWLAERLVRSRRARLVLVSRQGLDGPDGPTRDATVRRLTDAGGEVLVVAADVADPAAVRGAVARTVAHYGCLDAVVHAAAVPFGAMLEFRVDADAAATHATKVAGALALATAVADVPGVSSGIVLMMVSSVAVAGGAGGFDYLAANYFLDSWAQAGWAPHSGADRPRPRVLSVAWDRWRGVGMARALEDRHEELTGERLVVGMEPALAASALDHCLALASAGERYVMVSASGTVLPGAAAWLSSSRSASVAAAPPVAASDSPGAVGRHQRPAHLGVATEPATELERVLTQVWAQALNIESIGATDNFFELGGDSLVGMQVSRRLREVLDRSVPVRLLFRHPTARALAAALDRAVPEPDEAGATLVRAVRLTVDEIRAGRR